MKINAQNCKPIIVETGGIDLCVSGSSTTLIVDGPAISSYLWSTGETVSTIAVTVPGVYTVTATFTSGCTGTATIKVEATEYHVEVDQFVSTCFDGDQLITITNPEPGVTYYWSVGGGTAITAIAPGTGTSATISYAMNFNQNNYYIINYTHGSCDQADTFYLMPCCDFDWTPHRDFENVLSSTLDPSDFNSNSLIHLYGTITIDNAFTFDNCPNILMGPGAQIKIINGGFLHINDSYLSGACGRMWRGIKVEGNGNLRFAGSTLMDAEIGIDLENNSEIEISNGSAIPNSLFENNYISVRATGDFKNPSGINDAIFDYAAPFLALYPGQNLIPTNKPFAAFVLQDCNATGAPAVFGNSSGSNPIQINNHACGFYATNYTFDIFNTFFSNISNGTGYGGFGSSQNGWAVYAKATARKQINNCSVFIQGLGMKSLPLTFNNCKGGVYTRAMSASVMDCNMLCTEQGINNRLSQSPSAMRYLRNTINVVGVVTSPYSPTVALNGIYSQFSGTTVGTIAGNEINVDAPIAQTQLGQKSCCIQMDDVAGADNSLIAISTNISSQLNQTRYGMKFNNITSAQVDDNKTYCDQGTLSVDNFDLHYCYWSKNCIGLSFTNNFANNVSTVYKTNAIGYYNDISTRWIYGCNYAYQIGTGFRFDRDCSSPENFRGNFMENNDYGLYIDKPTGAIGTQTHRGNQWSIASLPAHMPNASVNGGAGTGSSQFYVHTATIPLNNYNPFFGGGLFNNLASGGPYSCVGSQIVAPSDSIAIVENEVHHADSTGETDNGEMGDYVLNRNLYGAIDDQYTAIATSNIIENYYDSMSLTATGKLQQVSNSYKNNLNELATITFTWQANDSVMRSNALQIMINNNALRNDNLNSTDSNTLVATNAALHQQNQLLAASNNDLANTAKWYHENTVASALNENSNVTASSNYTANQKAVHQIYARTIAAGNDNFTPTEITTLYNIAQQCLSYGGPAVLEARPIYALIDPTVNFEGTPCNLGGNRWGNNDDATTKTDELLVYPNPASTTLSLRFSNANDNINTIQIYNMMGVLLENISVKNATNSYQINVSTFPNGLYLIKVFSKNTSTIQTHKFQKQ